MRKPNNASVDSRRSLAPSLVSHSPHLSLLPPRHQRHLSCLRFSFDSLYFVLSSIHSIYYCLSSVCAPYLYFSRISTWFFGFLLLPPAANTVHYLKLIDHSYFKSLTICCNGSVSDGVVLYSVCGFIQWHSSV